MKTFKNLFFIGMIAALAVLTSAGPSQNGYQVGDKVADFSLKNIDGKMVSLSGIDAKGFIVTFTCNHCPFSKLYEDRIIALHKEFASKGYPVVAINPNDATAEPDDSFDNMIVRAKEKSFPFMYLHDESQQVAKAFGAQRTPHIFIVDKASMTVKYIGAIDNNAQDASAATEFYVKDAIGELMAGKSISKPNTKAIGCTVKWKKA